MTLKGTNYGPFFMTTILYFKFDNFANKAAKKPSIFRHRTKSTEIFSYPFLKRHTIQSSYSLIIKTGTQTAYK